MSSRVTDVLRRCRDEHRAALVGYLPVGYPDVDRSIEAMVAMVGAGVDVVEVGIPYSDPVMDGPVIQDAAVRALAGGVRLADAFRAVRAITDAGGAAVCMTYINPVLRYGVDRFAAELGANGGSGLITPDLIPDEAGAWIEAAERHDLDRIFLVAPSSTTERLASTAAACRGFVYVTALMGVTGARAAVGPEAAHLIERTRAVTDTPLCVGLGVSTREQAAQVASYADGVIVGSALVRALTDGVEELQGVVRELAAGVREGGR
ncbi:tryptophan synthase subunit alpha [uncultured Arsenicicoccus sp.]|uniref:tryptophan synthase subunit alpha n=1 Tax=uncultured Arsenicicoccus sp. TaxID=491339 RepID=UPI00259645A2|nr:tryptophan synthase subunit alpha [uncultured Arsenicicoccus sp.]